MCSLSIPKTSKSLITFTFSLEQIHFLSETIPRTSCFNLTRFFPGHLCNYFPGVSFHGRTRLFMLFLNPVSSSSFSSFLLCWTTSSSNLFTKDEWKLNFLELCVFFETVIIFIFVICILCDLDGKQMVFKVCLVRRMNKGLFSEA